MKIAVIHPSFTGGIGGAKQVSFEIADTLAKNHDVTHFTEHKFSKKKSKKLFDLKNYQYVEMKSISKPPYVKLIEKILSGTSRFTALKRAYNQKKFIKLYHKIESEYDITFFTADLYDYSKFYSKKNEFRSKNTDTIIYRHRGPGRNGRIDEKNPVYQFLISGNSNIKNFDSEKSIFNSKFSMKEGIKDGEVIYPPIKDRFNYIEDGDYIVCLDRISREKRLGEAIEISEESNIDLKIVGRVEDESYLEELKQKSGKNTEILTDVSDDELVEILEGAKYGLNCGKDTEGFGITTVEYMKSGTIPVVRDSAANKEVVEKEELRWTETKEAVEIIKKLEKNTEEAYNYIRNRKDDFSRKKFRKEIVETVNKTA